SIDSSEKSNDINIRIRNLNSHFTYSIYTNICQSLFEKDKFLFSFLLCTSILKTNDEIEDSELKFFLTGGLSIETYFSNPFPKWLPDKTWIELNKFQDLTNLSIVEHLRKNEEAWKDFMENPDIKIPYEKPISKFKKLILLKIFRQDKVIAATHKFVVDNLGAVFVEPPTFSLGKIFKNSRPEIPLIFILSPGVDPLSHMYKLADEYGMKDNIRTISLGQGQGPIALRNIEEGMTNGYWIVLQNCHLAASFLQEIEYTCETVSKIFFVVLN
ncbi:dynein heavy chain axonemal, partial [Brachionus plicatilis]